METREQYTAHTEAPEFKQFHVRFPEELLEWVKAEAKRNKRSASAEINMAVEIYRKQIEIYRS
jgi:hypothetical protein